MPPDRQQLEPAAQARQKDAGETGPNAARQHEQPLDVVERLFNEMFGDDHAEPASETSESALDGTTDR